MWVPGVQGSLSTLIGDILQCKQEARSGEGSRAVTVMKDGLPVGHVPRTSGNFGTFNYVDHRYEHGYVQYDKGGN